MSDLEARHRTQPPSEEAAYGPTHPNVRYEHSDVSFWGLVWFSVVLVLCCLAIMAAMWVVFSVVMTGRGWNPLAPAYSDTAPETFPRDPRLEGLRHVEELGYPEQYDLAPPQDYGWEDRSAGIVRMPVDVAVEAMLAQRNQVTDPREETANGHPPLP